MIDKLLEKIKQYILYLIYLITISMKKNCELYL
jgi:hypothetical protein